MRRDIVILCVLARTYALPRILTTFALVNTVSGSAWYLASYNANCHDTCALHGGCNPSPSQTTVADFENNDLVCETGAHAGDGLIVDDTLSLAPWQPSLKIVGSGAGSQYFCHTYSEAGLPAGEYSPTLPHYTCEAIPTQPYQYQRLCYCGTTGG